VLSTVAAAALSPAAAVAQEKSRRMTTPTPPVAPKVPKRIEQLGRVRVDDYAWLKDDSWQQVMRDPKVLRPDIRSHLEAENAYTKAMLARTEPLQAQMFEEMKGRIKQDDASVPAPDARFEYWSEYEIGAQHPRYMRKALRDFIDKDGTPQRVEYRAEPTPQVLLDVDALAKGKAYLEVSAAEHSPDHALYAYAADEQGSEVHRIYVKDLATGQVLPEPVESSTGNFAWSPDSKWLFWTLRDDNGRPAKIFRRPARGGRADDVEVYDEPDDGMFISVGTTRSGRFIEISAANQETGEVLLIPASDPTAAPKVVEPRVEGVLYDIDDWGDRLVIRTNADGAVDFKLMWADAANPGKASWREWIPHRPGVFVTGVDAYKDHLVRLERVNANNRLVVTDRALAEHEVGFDEAAYALSLEGGYEWATPVTRFVYNSPTTPRQWFDYDRATRQRTLRKTQEIPSGHDPAKYETRRLYARAADGAEVPITVLMKRGTPLDGSAPLLLYGYGSYGIPMEPSFSIRNFSLVDRGWIWATAHIRGGSEKGRGWFLDGRKAKKVNTFTDFITCAEHLTAQGYGRKGRIVGYGGSAGGLLMGAVANMRPDLWAGIIAAVPFVDVINTMSDVSLPLTPPEWPEWGNPIEDSAAYDTIAAYSPYDNVAAKPYPAILATGGLSDPRVTYWEPAKWAAKLREHTTGDKPVLLKINMEAGHGGASGRFDFLKEIALDYAFAVWALESGWSKA
jgi:oligopeptidase B